MSETHPGNQPEKVKKAFLRSERKGKNVQQKSRPLRLPLPPPSLQPNIYNGVRGNNFKDKDNFLRLRAKLS